MSWKPTELEIDLLNRLNELCKAGRLSDSFTMKFAPSIHEKVSHWVEDRDDYERYERPLTLKQHNAFWRIFTKYRLEDLPEFSDRADTIRTVCALLDTVDDLHKGYWADREATQCKKTIEETFKRLTQLRDAHVEDLKEPAGGANEEDPPFDFDPTEPGADKPMAKKGAKEGRTNDR